jgi:hypothetical protein
MCGDHSHSAGPDTRLVSRRRVLQGLVGLAGLAAIESATTRPVTESHRPRQSTVASHLSAFRLAMHLHASGSEGVGSMRSHLAEAAANGFDVAWFTEHDYFRRGMLRRSSYHFLPEDMALGGVWRLPALPPLGSLQPGSGGELVSDPTSPNDRASAKGSLKLTAVSTGADSAMVSHRIDSNNLSRPIIRGRILGRLVLVDVLPVTTGPDAWGEVCMSLSHHPASGDRPAGTVSLVYRFRSDVTARRITRNGTTGIIDVPVSTGRWQSVSLNPSHDVHAVWPDMQSSDNSLCDLEFHAVSRRMAPAEVFFSFLRFDETHVDGVGVEHQLVAAYADEEPGVLGLIGTEYSLGPHINGYGGAQRSYDYGPGVDLNFRTGEIRRPLVDFIHRHGGLASINHPFLPTEPWTATTPAGVAHDLLSINAGGADILEVGYGTPVTMHDNFAVWDTMSRNGLFLTGNGVTDDHSGQNWATREEGRFYTSAWAHDVTETSLLAALASGRTFVGYLGSFAGIMDMTMDGEVPMGAVSVDAATSRALRIDATDLPVGGAVEVVRGEVDFAGIDDPNPATTVVTTLGPSDLEARTAVPIDTSDDCFVRAQVVDGSGTVVAFGQPIWTLKTPPPGGIPAARRVRT